MFFAALVISAGAHAGTRDGFNDSQASSSLKKTLEQGSLNVQVNSGRTNLLLDHPYIRIALPQSVFSALGAQAC